MTRSATRAAFPVLASVLGGLAGLGALLLAQPLAARAPGTALGSLLLGAALATAFWFWLRSALGDAAALVALLGVWPLVECLVPAWGHDQGDTLLLAIAGVASLACIAVLTLALRRPPSAAWDSPRWPRLLAVVLVVYAAGAAAAACAVHARFGFWGRDEAVFLQSMWSSVHGFGFTNTLEGDSVSHFAIHNSPLLFLWWPFYRLVPRAETLLVLNALAVAASPVPLYLLARETLPRLPAAALALAFVAHPFVLGTPTLTITEAAFTYLPLLIALWGVASRRPSRVWLGALGLLAVQEYLGLALVGIGLLCLARRMPRTGMAVMASGLVWLAVTIFIVFPRLGSEELQATGFTCRYGHLGRTPGEVVKRFLSDPAGISLRLARDKKEWLYYGLAPALGPLPWLAPQAWAALPTVYPLVLQGAAMSPHKFAAWPPFLYAALPGAAALLARRLRSTGFRLTERDVEARTALVIAILALGGGVAAYHGWAYYRGPQMTRAQRALAAEAMALIPKEASVSAPDMLLPALSSRREVRVVWWSLPTDWILAETEPLRIGYTPQGVSQRLLAEGGYVLVFRKDGLDLWKRPR